MIKPPGISLFQSTFTVRWGDMDALGHVNNTVYFRYFEQIRIEWYESLDFGALSGSDDGMIIVDNHAEYLKPLVYPAAGAILMHGHSPGRSSFVSTYALLLDGELYARGESKIVWIDRRAGKSVPLPEQVRALLGGADGE